MLDKQGVIDLFRKKGLKTTTMEEQVFNEELLIPMKIGTHLDHLFSMEGGILPGTNIMMPGTPGIGKSTVALDILAHLKQNGRDVYAVNGEMPRLDMFKMSNRFRHFKSIPMTFMDDYSETIDPELIIRAALSEGYDAVLIDSMSEIINMFADFFGEAPKQATSRFLDLIKDFNEGKNDKGKFTSFLLIQQVTKGDVFVGSNRLKHMTQATMELRYRDVKNKIDSYIFFSKNRDAKIGQEIDFKFIPKEEDFKQSEIWFSEPSFYYADHPNKSRMKEDNSKTSDGGGGLIMEELLSDTDEESNNFELRIVKNE